MALDADVRDDPPPRGESPRTDDLSVRSVRSSGTDPPETPAMGSFVQGVSSLWRRSVQNITSRQRRSFPQDLSGISILPNESRTFDRGVTAHTVTSNQNGSVTELSVPGVFVSPESDRQQQQHRDHDEYEERHIMMDTGTSRPRGGDPDGSSYLELDLIAITNANANANANSSQN